MNCIQVLLFALAVVGLTSCAPASDKKEMKGKQETKRVSTPGAVEVLNDFLANKDLSERKRSFVDALSKNVDQGQYLKALDIYRNVAVHYDDEAVLQAITPEIIDRLEDKKETLDFIQALKSAYVTRFPREAYSMTHLDMMPISDLLANKAELINHPSFNRFSKPDALAYIDMSEAYMLIDSKNPAAADNLIKAANLAKSIPGYAPKAVALYNWIIEKQPDHGKASQALFMKAFTLENDLGKHEEAKMNYELFLEKYPSHVLAKDAKLSLQNVGKTDKEILESILGKDQVK